LFSHENPVLRVTAIGTRVPCLYGNKLYFIFLFSFSRCPRGWIVEFLQRDGLGALLSGLRAAGGKSLLDTMAQLQCVECLRAVVRSRTGLHYISTHLEYSSYLASGSLIFHFSRHRTVIGPA
jgi:hypothetical protein